MQHIKKLTKLKHLNFKSIDLTKNIINTPKHHFATHKGDPGSETVSEKIIGACVVARAPLVKAAPPIWEQEYKEWQRKFKEKKSKAIPENWDDKKESIVSFEEAQDVQAQKQQTWKPNPIISNSGIN